MRRDGGSSGIYTMAVAGVFLAGFFLTVIFGAQTYREIARAEGVDKSAVRRSVLSGIAQMKKYFRKNP